MKVSERPGNGLTLARCVLAAGLLAGLAGLAAPPQAGAATPLPAPAPAHDCLAYSGIPDGFGPATDKAPNRSGLVAIPGGRFLMGADDGYPEEKPVHPVTVAGFLIDRHEVTNAQFARFVAATGYVTRAEHPPDLPHGVQVPDAYRQPGSAVFVPPARPSGGHAGAGHGHDDHGTTGQHGAYQWWAWVPGANWRHPGGPDTGIEGLENHPVVHIAYEDAQAYARWLGRDLPTEAQWEYAARGGLEGATYPWGNTPELQGRLMANTWQGNFPAQNLVRDGYAGSAPVGCFPANGHGLWDAVGNVWEWTRDPWRPYHDPQASSEPPAQAHIAPGRQAATRVIKGGSFLCAPNFCVRYRPASRQPQEAVMSTMHVGFRTVLNLEP